MTNTVALRQPSAIALLVLAGAIALTGCSATADASTAGSSTDTGTSSTESTDDGASADGEVQVIGEDLPSYTGLLLATTYAEGRDPQPTVEFLDATSVKFTFPEEFPLEQAISNCQIAWGSLQGEGIHVYITSGSVEQDCTAEMEG